MQTPSLGRRVVVAGVTVVAILGASLDILLYVSLKSSLKTALDNDLDRVAAVVTAEASILDNVTLPGRLTQLGVQATIRDADGRVTAVQGMRVPPNEPLVSRRVALPDGGTAVIAMSRADADGSLRRLLRLELIVSPLVVALALFLLRLVAEIALRPLDRIAAAARRTAGGHRGERLHPRPADTRLGQMASAYDEMLDALEAAVADAEAAHAESTLLLERNRRIIETAREAYVAIDEDGLIVDWNREAERTFGWRRDEAIGRSVAGKVTPPGPGGSGLRIFVGAPESEQRDRVVEFTALHRDGHQFPARMVLWTTRHYGTSTVNAFAWDVTEQVKAEDAVARLAAIVESADEAMLSTTLDGTILTWNGGAERIYGYTAAEAVGMPIQLIVPKNLREEVSSSLDVVRRGEAVQRAGALRQCKNGTLIEVALTMSPVRDASGVVCAASSIDRDITEERWIAGQLDDTLAALEAAAEEARESEVATRRFLDDAAHQMRAPITNIQACAEVLLRSTMQLDPVERDDLLGAVLRETSRAGRLVAGLLRIARLNHGTDLAPQPCDVLALCREEEERAQARSPHLDVIVSAAAPTSLDEPWLDPHAVSEILSNLVDNARRHAASRIELAVCQSSGWVQIEVRDDGPGLPEGMAEAAFDRFVSLDGKGGSGLGLPIARELARAHGGELSYQSGAFVVRLPTLDGGQPIAESEQAVPGC